MYYMSLEWVLYKGDLVYIWVVCVLLAGYMMYYGLYFVSKGRNFEYVFEKTPRNFKVYVSIGRILHHIGCSWC